MSAKMNSALTSYNDYGTNAEIEYASPHRLIQLLFEGVLKRIAFAKGAMQRKQIIEKGKFISQAISIVGGLQASLDAENGGDMAVNLNALYDYISRRLVTANLENSEEILDEVAGLLINVKTAWDAIDSTPAQVDVNAADNTQNTVATAETVEDKAEAVVTKKPKKSVNARANRALKAYSS
jgi:flagellar protein FliS